MGELGFTDHKHFRDAPQDGEKDGKKKSEARRALKELQGALSRPENAFSGERDLWKQGGKNPITEGK